MTEDADLDFSSTLASLQVLHRRLFRTAEVLMTAVVLGGGSDALQRRIFPRARGVDTSRFLAWPGEYITPSHTIGTPPPPRQKLKLYLLKEDLAAQIEAEIREKRHAAMKRWAPYVVAGATILAAVITALVVFFVQS